MKVQALRELPFPRMPLRMARLVTLVYLCASPAAVNHGGPYSAMFFLYVLCVDGEK